MALNWTCIRLLFMDALRPRTFLFYGRGLGFSALAFVPAVTSVEWLLCAVRPAIVLSVLHAGILCLNLLSRMVQHVQTAICQRSRPNRKWSRLRVLAILTSPL
jgi:hypothetical protein